MATIRAALENDIAAIQALASVVLRQTATADSVAVDRMLARVYAQDSLRRSIVAGGTTLLVAEHDDALVGLCQFGSPLIDECEDRKEIHRLLIHPGFCRQGIGGQFVAAVEADLREDVAVARVSVYVHPDDMARIRFFAKQGFHHEAVEDKDGEWYMEKDI